MPNGDVRALSAGTVLYESGSEPRDFFVVLDGEVEVVRPGDDEVRVARWGPGGFLGELNLLTGQRPLFTARMVTDGRVLAVELETFHRLMSTHPDFSDVVFRAFLARRGVLRAGDGASAIRIIGSRFSPEALALRSFANRSRLPHTWIDLDDLDDAGVFLASVGARVTDVPIVITPTARLVRPTPGDLAQHLGMTFRSQGALFDLAVVGSGPAGLAAAVYGASEGLNTISLDAVAIGGQAGTSSRIENYVGFPNGISGEDLAANAALQALRLGARLNAPCEVTALRVESGFHVLSLSDGSELPARAVMIATGARYRRLPIENLSDYEGAGVYYAATELEVRSCADQPVIVVGGGNSAGQAAIFLSQHGCRVTIAIRGDDLSRSMSHYLIERIVDSDAISVRTNTEVRALAGANHLERVGLETAGRGEIETVPCSGLFSFIGAAPATEWLGDVVARDRLGFVLTDRALTDAVMLPRTPLPFESSQPGIFAAGDVRHDSMKRVASAVGEGSSAVHSVYEYLATLAT
jgi:thioredoxin reductase (NADPH)